MQDHGDQLLVDRGHPDQITGVLRVRTQEGGLDRRFALEADQRLPGALVGQGWLGLGWDRCGRCLVARSPGGLDGCRTSRGDAWDAAGEAAANLGRVGFVLDLFQIADRPTQPVEPAPLGQPRSRTAVSYTHLTLPTNREV